MGQWEKPGLQREAPPPPNSRRKEPNPLHGALIDIRFSMHAFPPDAGAMVGAPSGEEFTTARLQRGGGTQKAASQPSRAKVCHRFLLQGLAGMSEVQGLKLWQECPRFEVRVASLAGMSEV